MELRWDGIGRDILVMRREGVSGKAKGADPKAGAGVDLAVLDVSKVAR